MHKCDYVAKVEVWKTTLSPRDKLNGNEWVSGCTKGGGIENENFSRFARENVAAMCSEWKEALFCQISLLPFPHGTHTSFPRKLYELFSNFLRGKLIIVMGT